MNSLIRTRFLAAAALALGALGVASAAHARSDVSFFVGVQAPIYLEPAPIYVQPRPVYVQPRVVYSQPPVYRYSYEDERARRHGEWRRSQWQHRDHHDNRDWNRDGGRSHGRNRD
jgi:hypothetical protein